MSSGEFEAELKFKENVDFGDLVKDAILTCNRSVMAKEFSEMEIIEATKNLRSLIAEPFEDEDFKKQLETAKVKRKIDVRPRFCGIAPSEEYCKEHGITAFVEQETFDYEKLKRVCMNFLARTGVLCQKDLVEQIEGIEFAETGTDETRKNALPSK